MWKLLILIPVFAFARVETTRVLVSDTSVVKVRNDTLRFVIVDSLRITRTLKDTVLVLKIDTVKASSKPAQLKGR